MKRVLLLPYIFAFLITPVLSQIKEAQKEFNSKTLITISRGGFGKFPVYSAKIYGNGTVTYKGVYCVKVIGKRKYKIPREKVEKLVKEFQRVDYFSLNEKYEGTYYSESFTTTSILLNGRRKKIVNGMSAPTGIRKLEDKIDEIAGLLKLVK